MATEGLPPTGGASRPPRGTWQAALATVGGAVLSQSPLRCDVTHRHHCPCKREGLGPGLPDLAGLPCPSQTQSRSQTGGEEDTAWTLVWSLGALQTADIIEVGNFGKQARRLSSVRLPSRLKMVFGLGCQRERLYKPLYIAHLFILAGVVYYYFQGPVGKTAPDHDVAEEPSQLEGETLRPVWGPMDKCYPVTTQRRRVKSGKKQASEAMTPKVTGGLSSAAPTEETELWSQREGEVRPPEDEAASLGPVAKEVAEEQEAAGTLGWEVSRDVGQETVAYPPEVSEEDSEEESPGGWVPQLLWKLWLDWFPAPDIPKTQNHE